MAIVSVQRVTADDAAATTHTLTIAASTAGSTILVGARINNTTDASVVTSVKLGAGGANRDFTRVRRQFGTGTARNLECWILENAAGSETVITLTLSASFIVRWGAVEVTGLATSASVDKSNSAADVSASTALNSGSVTTTQADEFLFVIGASDLAATFTVGATYGNLVTATRYAQEERIVSAIGTYSGTMSINTSMDWSCMIVTVKAAIAASTTGATLTIQTELGGFGLGWTDISVDVSSADVHISRGFQSSNPDDLVAVPATCQFELLALNGIVGYYSPDSINCRVGWGLTSRVRVQITAAGSTRTRFIGWIQSISAKPGLYEDRTVKVTAASWLQLAADTLATGLNVQINKRGDELVAMLATVPQFAPPATSYNVGVDTYPYSLDDLNANSSYVIDGLDSVAKSGLDRIFETADGTLVYENRSQRQIGANNIITLSDVAPVSMPGLAITAMPIMRTRATLWNQFLVNVHPRKVDGAAVVLHSYNVASNPTIAAGATVILDGQYQDPSQLAQHVAGIGMIDNGAGGLPAGDWEIRDAPNGGGSIISGSFTVGVVFEVNKAIFTIVSASGVIGYINKLQCRGQGVYSYQNIIGRAINATGVLTMGRRSVSLDCPYQVLPTFAQDLANFLLALWGTERSQLGQGVTAFCNSFDESSINTLLALEISNPIGIQETVTGLTGAYWIDGVTETYDERTNLTISFRLVPRWAGQVWQLGTAGSSELGNTSVLAYV